MLTYAELLETINIITESMALNRNRVDRSLALVTSADTELGELATTHSASVADINTGLTANPSDPAWQVLKAKKDILVAEFVSQKAEATSVKNAINAILNS